MILSKTPFSHNHFQEIYRSKKFCNSNFFQKAKNFCSDIDTKDLTNTDLPLACKRYFALLEIGIVKFHEIPDEIFVLTFNTLKNSNTKGLV